MMIHFGCNASPWYDPSPRCRNGQGLHHGVDFDMPVGTTVRAAVAGRVIVNPATAGPSYGRHRVIIRTRDHDILLAHLASLKVTNGQQVSPGEVVGRSGMSGVEDLDGPHLHLEVRPVGARHTAAIDPWSLAKAVTA